MPGRQFTSSNGYRYGFNGKENDNEVKGEGNSLDFGARIYDSRLGRFLSVDPLQKKYPAFSPYNFCANNPIYNIEVDGRYFTGNTATVKAVYAIASALAAKGDKSAIAYKTALEKMDASDIEFNVTINSKKFDGGGKHGETSFDFNNNKVTIEVNDYFQDSGPNSTEANLAHELEHGRQFMDGEIDFIETNGVVSPGPSYDKQDEYNAIDAQNLIEKGSNSGKEVTKDKIKNQKDLYSNRQAGPINTSQEKTEYMSTDKGKSQSKSSDYKSKDNYQPTDKQKNEKKSILKK